MNQVIFCVWGLHAPCRPMPPDNYAWLATLALLAARNLTRSNMPGNDSNRGGPVVTQVTAVAGLLEHKPQAANEPVLFLLVLCQNARVTARTVTAIAILCQIAARPAKAPNPSPRAASRASLLTLVLCQIDHPPTRTLVTEWSRRGVETKMGRIFRSNPLNLWRARHDSNV